MPFLPQLCDNATYAAAATRVGCGAFPSGGVVCMELRVIDSESNSACSGSANILGVGRDLEEG